MSKIKKLLLKGHLSILSNIVSLQKGKQSSSISNLKKQKTPLKSDNRVKSVIDSASKKAKCNPDLIKACEIIMKKVQNT
jgi:hypothetical protein